MKLVNKIITKYNLDKPYISSIIHNYGDMPKVKNDFKTINEIVSRQGLTILIRALAENIGESSLKFKLNFNDRTRLFESVMTEVRETILERI